MAKKGTLATPGALTALVHREMTHRHVVDSETGRERWVRDDGSVFVVDPVTGGLVRDSDGRALLAYDSWALAVARGEALTVSDRHGREFVTTAPLQDAERRKALHRMAANRERRERRALALQRAAESRSVFRNPDVPAVRPDAAPRSPVRAAFVAAERSDPGTVAGAGVAALRSVARHEARPDVAAWREARALAEATEAARLARIRAARREALARGRAARAMSETAAREARELAERTRAAKDARRKGRVRGPRLA